MRIVPCPTIEAWARHVMRTGSEERIGPKGERSGIPAPDLRDGLPEDPRLAVVVFEERKRLVVRQASVSTAVHGIGDPADLGGYLLCNLWLGRIARLERVDSVPIVAYPWLLRRALLHVYWTGQTLDTLTIDPAFADFKPESDTWREQWRRLGMESPIMRNSAEFVLRQDRWVPALAIGSAVREFRVTVCSNRPPIKRVTPGDTGPSLDGISCV